MKSALVGSLLLQALNAQLLPDTTILSESAVGGVDPTVIIDLTSSSTTVALTIPSSDSSPGQSWSGEDNSIYDGQDYGEDPSKHGGPKDECPSYCFKKQVSDYSDGDDDYSDDNDYDDDDSFSRFVRKLVRFGRRQSWTWPTSSKKPDMDVCSDDVPAWLYSITKKLPCKPKKCPASCFKKPAPAGYYATKTYATEDPYETSEPYATNATSPYESYPSETPYEEYSSSSSGYDDATSYAWEPTDSSTWGFNASATSSPTDSVSSPEVTETGDPAASLSDESSATISDGSAASTSDDVVPVATGDAAASTDDSGAASTGDTAPSIGDSTSLTTATTFVTSVVTVPAVDTAAAAPTAEQAAAAPAAPAAPGGGDSWTGDTLATVCPKQCNPFDPAANKCDITSSCTTTGSNKYYCACRAGFRASAWNAKDFSKQFKIGTQPYVYTAEGVVCDTVCADQTCSEVLQRPACQ